MLEYCEEHDRKFIYCELHQYKHCPVSDDWCPLTSSNQLNDVDDTKLIETTKKSEKTS